MNAITYVIAFLYWAIINDMELVKKIFNVNSMLKEDEIKGDLPSNSSAYKKVLNIAWPSVCEQVLVALIGAMDLIMVGGISMEAISAVGICNQPKFLCLAPIFAINTAAIVLVSRRKGQGRQKEANDYMHIAIIISCVFSVVCCGLSFVFCEDILRFAGANSDYLELACSYYRIVLISLIPFSIGLTMTAAQRGAGYTKISLVTNLVANIVNVIFNAILINGLFGFPKLGVVGAAIATAIGNSLSFVIALVSLLVKDRYLKLSLEKIEDFFHKVKDIFNIFTSTFVEQIVLRFGFFTYAKVVASLGTAEFAAHNIVMNIASITFSVGDGLQIANTSMVGQSLGQNRSDLAKIYTRITHIFGMSLAIIICILITTLHVEICGIYTDVNEVIELATIPMFMLGLTCLFQIPQTIITGALRGAGDVKYVTIVMTICVGFIRPFCSYILAYNLELGLIGAWITFVIDQVLRFVLTYKRLRTGKWEKISV